MDYPRPILEIHQIELTSRCNLRCRYCPSPKLPRPKIDMTDDIFEAALDLVRFYCRMGTQTELSLTGIGEPLLHPKFIDMVAKAREAIGWDRPLVVATNGILLSDSIAERLAEHQVRVFISLHRPEVAGPAIERAKKHGIFAASNNSAATSAFNWAGQVNWFVSAPKSPCEYLRSGWGVVLADGRITTCCLDADGSGVVGTVHDEHGSLGIKPYRHCDTCHMTAP